MESFFEIPAAEFKFETENEKFFFKDIYDVSYSKYMAWHTLIICTTPQLLKEFTKSKLCIADGTFKTVHAQRVLSGHTLCGKDKRKVVPNDVCALRW